jgi:hypothetical protein
VLTGQPPNKQICTPESEQEATGITDVHKLRQCAEGSPCWTDKYFLIFVLAGNIGEFVRGPHFVPKHLTLNVFSSFL